MDKDDKALLWWWGMLLLALVAGLAIIAWASVLQGAPAPVFRAAPALTRSALVGEWDAEWVGHCRMTLGADGSYTCDWQGTRYWGEWWLASGVLHVRESWRPWGRHTWTHYAVRLDRRTMSGTFEGGATLTLRRAH